MFNVLQNMVLVSLIKSATALKIALMSWMVALRMC